MTQPIDVPGVVPVPHAPVERSASSEGAPSLAAICALSFLCSIGTGVVWSGVSFVAKEYYNFSQSTTLWLYVALGSTYVVGALSAGRGLRRIEQTLSPRGALAAILVISAIACSSLWLSDAPAMLWGAVLATNMVMSWLWPIVESYVTAGRHGRDMRHALGVWNLTWTSAVVLSLVAMAPVIEHHAIRALQGTALLFALSLLPLFWLPRSPAAHGEPDAGDDEHATNRREYPQLLQASRILLPVSYVLNSGMLPLLPYLLAGLAVAPVWRTPLAATWALSRLLTMLVLWKGHFWHGRWGTLLLGAASQALGFGVVVMSASLPMMLGGLVLVGVGMAVQYYATLYYSMTVGRAAVDASGTFEALIGGGYTVGPLLALLGGVFSDRMATTRLGPDGGVILLVWAFAMILGVAALRAYLEARRTRSGT